MIEAKYTKLFNDWAAIVPNPTIPYSTYAYILQQQVFNQSPFDNTKAQKLFSELISVFRYYEIGSDDDTEFLQFLTDVFKEYSQYYYDIISNYEKEYDYALNNKRVITKNDKLNMVGNTNVVNENKDKQTEYQLPNKVIDDSYRSTPSNIVDTDSKNNNDKNYTNDTSRDTVTTTEFNNEFIDLKNKYMNQIRNVYREFAMKFKDCFYQVY